MAFHLNLYHAMQKLALERQRDPLKLGLYAVMVVVVFLMLYYFYRLEQVSVFTSQARKLQTAWDLKSPKAKDALAQATQLNTNVKLKDDLENAMENRFYWAPFLERIQNVVPSNVQITHLHGVVDPGAGLIEFAGVGAGDQPRKVVEKFRTDFIEKGLLGYKKVASKFNSLEDSDATVQLDAKSLNTALFSLQFNFTLTDGTSAAAPAVKKGQKGAR